MANAIVQIGDKQSGVMSLALGILNVPKYLHHDVRNCWRKAGYPSLYEYAPYAAFVLTVELFFYIALTESLISSVRASNRVDIAYLFYLPFCMMFVSNDRLHRNCTSLFLRDDQEFVWGQDLKKSLSNINEYHLQLQDDVNKKGVLSLSSDLPPIKDPLLDHLWSRLLPKYQKRKEEDTANSSPTKLPTLEEIKGMEKAPPLSPEELVNFDPQSIEAVLIKHRTRRTKGSWQIVPD